MVTHKVNRYTEKKVNRLTKKQVYHSILRYTRIYQYLKLLFIIGAVVALGLWAMNLFIDYAYKSQLLMSPCELCEATTKYIEVNFSNVTFKIISP